MENIICIECGSRMHYDATLPRAILKDKVHPIRDIYVCDGRHKSRVRVSAMVPRDSDDAIIWRGLDEGIAEELSSSIDMSKHILLNPPKIK